MSISSNSAWKYFAVFLVASIMVIPAYAEPITQTTSGGTINVVFSTDPATPNPGDQTQLKVTFINKQTKAVQVHVDYKVSVLQGGNQVFGIPITHTAEGVGSIPFQFQSAGTYQVIVEVDGLVFQPLPPETATFSVTVGQPSNGTGNVTSQYIPAWIKKNAGWWADGSIDDSTFVQGIQYMIQHGIMKVPHGTQSSSSNQIPAWIKKNAGWWADGSIDDNTFVQGIQWLITNGIIRI